MTRRLRFALLAAACAALVPASMVGASTPADGSDAALSVVQELSVIYRTQQSDGDMEFTGSRTFYRHNPVMATMAWQAHRRSPGAAFLSQSAAALTRYYQFLFTHRDRNGNLLIETVVRDVDGTEVTVEDPGFNSLLALDMMSLAAMYVELRKPMRALYWYEGARTLQSRIVASTFDPDATFFFPLDTRRGWLLRGSYALSALPVLFPLEVGHNHAAAIAAHYVIGPGGAGPERLSSYVESPAFASPSTPTQAAATGTQMLKAIALVEVLRQAGRGEAADRAVAAAVAALDLVGVGSPGAPHVTAYHRLFAALLRGGDGRFFTRGASLDVVRGLALQKRALPDNALIRSADDTRAVLDAERGVEPDGIDAVDKAVRACFVLISNVRKATARADFVTRDDAYDLSGVQAGPALERVLTDAADVIRRSENALFTARVSDTGLAISAGLMRDRGVIGRDSRMRWTLVPTNRPATVGWLEVRVPGTVDTLVTRGGQIEIAPGRPAEFTTVMRPRTGTVSTLNRIDATVAVEVDGRRLLWHTINTVYLEHAVDVLVTFPRGRVLGNQPNVPMDVRVVRRVREDMTIRARWHSPAGLRLREGDQTQFTLGVEQDTVTVRYNVLVPQPCRPGRFPFKMGFSQGSDQLGVVSSHMYRPFQWLFAGPFRAAPGAMSTAYPPERHVNLYADYEGASGRVGWKMVPQRAHLGDGAVSLSPMVRGECVGYLYTVVSAPGPIRVPARLAASVPAALFVNGERVIDDASAAGNEPAYERVQLREGLNEIMIKVRGDENASVYFDLGDEMAMAPDEFSNNLWELIDSFQRFVDYTHSGGGDEEVHRTVTLRYVDETAGSVSVIGSFNGWSPEHSRMKRVSNNTWEITLSLAPGRYTYRLLVDNRKQILDPGARETEADGYGGRNSVLVIADE